MVFHLSDFPQLASVCASLEEYFDKHVASTDNAWTELKHQSA